MTSLLERFESSMEIMYTDRSMEALIGRGEEQSKEAVYRRGVYDWSRLVRKITIQKRVGEFRLRLGSEEKISDRHPSPYPKQKTKLL